MINRFLKPAAFTPQTFKTHWYKILIAALILVGISVTLGSSFPAFAAPAAANPDGDLRIEPMTAYNLVVDSNVLSPSTYGPESATVAANFCNDGGNDLTNVFAYIGDATSPSTPGIYPSRGTALHFLVNMITY